MGSQSPRYNMGNYQIFLFWFKNQLELPVLRSIFFFKSKGQKNKQKHFKKILSLMSTGILYSKNQSEMKNLFATFLDVLKRVIFP